MKDYFPDPSALPPVGQRGRGQLLGNAARAFLIAAAVILAVGGLVVVGCMVVLVVGLNSWGSNK